MLENRFELILRGLIRAGSSHTMSPVAKIKTRSQQLAKWVNQKTGAGPAKKKYD